MPLAFSARLSAISARSGIWLCRTKRPLLRDTAVADNANPRHFLDEGEWLGQYFPAPPSLFVIQLAAGEFFRRLFHRDNVQRHAKAGFARLTT